MASQMIERASMLVFALGAMRAILEMLAYSLLGQGMLYLLVGDKRNSNPVYQLFSLLTRHPRMLVEKILPSTCSALLVGAITFFILLGLWLGLALMRKFI